MSGHTPGPWSIRKAKHPVDDAWDWAIGTDIDDHAYCIAEAFGRAAQDIFLPAEANARLIAAAPELLEALRTCKTMLIGVPSEGAAFAREKADAAIAKATGEQS